MPWTWPDYVANLLGQWSIRIAERNTPCGSSGSVYVGSACWAQWVQSLRPSITRWSNRSSVPCRSSCSTAEYGPAATNWRPRSSNTSKCFTTRSAASVPWTTPAQPITKDFTPPQRWREHPTPAVRETGNRSCIVVECCRDGAAKGAVRYLHRTAAHGRWPATAYLTHSFPHLNRPRVIAHFAVVLEPVQCRFDRLNNGFRFSDSVLRSAPRCLTARAAAGGASVAATIGCLGLRVGARSAGTYPLHGGSL